LHADKTNLAESRIMSRIMSMYGGTAGTCRLGQGTACGADTRAGVAGTETTKSTGSAMSAAMHSCQYTLAACGVC